MPSVLAMETAAPNKLRRYSRILREPKAVSLPDPERIEHELRVIRTDAVDRQAELVSRATAVWSNEEDMHIVLAHDADDAIREIAAVSGETRRIAVNKSSVVRNELTPGLQKAGFPVIETYYEQFHPFESRFTEYWQLPKRLPESMWTSFQVTQDLVSVRRSSIEAGGARDVIGLLGVNVVSSEDGAIFLLQHGHNISDIFAQAKEVVLVAGLDKFVVDAEAAALQAQCMALYGSESLLLDLHHKTASGESFDSLPFEISAELAGKKVHVLVLDNGRSRLLDSRYRDLLLCIDCRACARVCPIGEIEARSDERRRSPREYAYAQALEMSTSPRQCLQCRRCDTVCPVGIDLPRMIMETSVQHGTKLPGALADLVLRNPETLLSRASRMPFLYNAAMNVPLLSRLGKTIMGISAERKLPRVHRNTFARWFHSSARRPFSGVHDA